MKLPELLTTKGNPADAASHVRKSGGAARHPDLAESPLETMDNELASRLRSSVFRWRAT